MRGHSHDSIYNTHEFDLLTRSREIFLFGREDSYAEDDEPGVDYRMANRFIRNLRLLDTSDAPVLVHMKTNGGYWEEGMAIYQAIKSCRSYVTILNYTHARSMSSIILQAADRRVMMPYSVFMYHDGTIGHDGTVKQFWTEAEQLKASDKLMFDIYLDQCEDAKAWKGKTRTQIKNSMRRQMDRKEEVYLTAHETVDHGFADEVLEDFNITRIRAAQ